MNNADIVPSLAKITLYSSEDRIKHLCEFVITNCDNSMTETNREWCLDAKLGKASEQIILNEV